MTAQRRLAAILVADVVGYSKLIGGDETGTLAKLSALRREIVDPEIARHAGRLFKAVGDGFLVESASAVQAVTAARAIQEANAGGGLSLRIGIHIGDVIVEGSDLMGDGVNIASRIEGLADAGGIALSRQVHDLVRDRLDLAFIDKGEVTLKNIARPVHVFAVTGSNPSASAATLALPDKPSIAVLPFQNMSGDPEQEYFADGMVEDIITALSRFKSLFVITRNSSFTYKGKAVDIKQVGRELGVRYVLKGSVRKAANKVRITGQLIDAETGAHLWADRFDGSLEDVFELQDHVTTSVVGAISPKLAQAEMERVKRKPVENLDAYDSFLQGMSLAYVFTREAVEGAFKLLYRAIELAPDFATPHGMAARLYAYRRLQGWSVDPEWEVAEARRLALRVSSIGRDDALALCWAGYALVSLCREHEAGAAMIDQALALNQNLATAWSYRGLSSVSLGQHEAALEQIAKAIRLSPLDPETYRSEGVMSMALLMLGRYDEALKWSTRSYSRQSNWMPALRVSAAANAYLGNTDEAQKFIARICQHDPGLGIARLKTSLIYRRPEDIGRFVEGLRLAGLPE